MNCPAKCCLATQFPAKTCPAEKWAATRRPANRLSKRSIQEAVERRHAARGGSCRPSSPGRGSEQLGNISSTEDAGGTGRPTSAGSIGIRLPRPRPRRQCSRLEAPRFGGSGVRPARQLSRKVGINPDLIPFWRGPPPRFGPLLPGTQRAIYGRAVHVSLPVACIASRVRTQTASFNSAARR